jgi:plasmid stabilization system protein ParE
MSYRVIITPNAESDLRQAYQFIRKDSALAAGRWVRDIRKVIKSLSTHPERCALAPEAEMFDEPIRELLYGRGNRGTYRILFAVEAPAVYVLAVRHGSRTQMRQ